MHTPMRALMCGSRHLAIGERTLVMGIVNVTPDSFSDGGKYHDPVKGVEHGLRLIKEGADILDIGGVATSPHLNDCAKSVSEDEECARVVPVIAELARRGIDNISIDTTRAAVAEAALDVGASWINDQSAGLDPAMARVMTRAQGVVLMHNHGEHSGVEAGEKITYDDIMAHLLDFFSHRIGELDNVGVSAEKIIIDPGVGFGKGLSDSLTIINSLSCLKKLNAVTMVGLSRKSFIYQLTGIIQPVERDFATLGANAAAIFSGADIIRTHNVRATVEMALVLNRCLKREGFKAHLRR